MRTSFSAGRYDVLDTVSGRFHHSFADVTSEGFSDIVAAHGSGARSTRTPELGHAA